MCAENPYIFSKIALLTDLLCAMMDNIEHNLMLNIDLVIKELCKDKILILKYESFIRELHNDMKKKIANMCKSLCYMHNFRMDILPCSELNFKKYFKKQLIFVNHSNYKHYVSLFQVLLNFPDILAELIYQFKLNIKITRKLLNVLFCLSLSFVNLNDILFLHFVISHFIRRCVLNSYTLKTETNTYLYMLLFFTPDAQVYSQKILNAFTTKLGITDVLFSMDLSNSYFDNDFKESKCDHSLLIINDLIDVITDNFQLFPRSILLFIGDLRHVYRESGYQQPRILYECLKFIFVDFLNFTFMESGIFKFELFVFNQKLHLLLKEALGVSA